MTNIDNINETGQGFSPPKNQTGNLQKTDAFHNALNNAIEGRSKPEKSSSPTGSLKEISSMGPVIKSPSDIVTGHTDKLINMLESYSSKLGDPNISLKSIAPDLEQIKTDAAKLELEAKNLSDKDASLKEIATQTIVTAQTEYFKFQRGDYAS